MPRPYRLLLIGILLLASAGSERATCGEGVSGFPIQFTLEPMSAVEAGVPTTFKFICGRNPDYRVDEVHVNIVPDNLDVQGANKWDIALKSNEPCTTYFQIIIPPSDTSGFVMNIDCGVTKGPIYRYFVTADDSVASFAWNVRSPTFRTAPPIPKEAPSPDDEKAKSMERTGRHQLTRDDAMRSEMRKMELTPHLSPIRQTVWISGEVWIRDSGEYKFRLGKPVTIDERKERAAENSNPAGGSRNLYEVVLDLRDTANFNFVASRTKGLKPTEESGYYRLTTDKSTLGEIEKHGVTYRILSTTPIGTPGDATERSDPQSLKSRERDQEQSLLKPSEVFYIDDFNASSFLNLWWVRDENAASGYDYWFPYYVPGNFYAWCVGSGDTWQYGHYDNNMQAQMSSYPALDISHYTDINVSFKFYYEIEPYWDRITWYDSDNGSQWMERAHWSGTSSGWIQVTASVSASRGDYYVRFEFSSDSSICFYDGAYIDDFQLSGEQRELPNLTYDWPSGWDWPVVASPDAGTHSTGTLYGNEQTYIDWAVTNWGLEAAQSFKVRLYIDGAAQEFTVSNGLDPWESFQLLDYCLTTIAPGPHTLKLVIDPNDEVLEDDEDDNEFQVDFYWNEQQISYSGYITYSDPAPGGYHYNPGRLLWVELRDWDPATHDYDVLWSTTTDRSGYYSTPMVSNIEPDNQTRQDIVIRVWASNSSAQVRPSRFDDIYCFETIVYSEHRSGSYPLDIEIPSDYNDPFFVADALLSGRDKWRLYRDEEPPSVLAVLSPYVVSGHTNGIITIDASDDVTKRTPDTYDKWVVLHEYGHFLAYSFGFFDNSPGYAHSWQVPTTKTEAASEGFAHFFAAMASNDAQLKDQYFNFTQYFGVNLENGEYGYNSYTNSANFGGECVEAAVAGILWDIHDNVPDDYTIWHDASGVGFPDGWGDTLGYGTTTLFSTLFDTRRYGRKPDDILEFREQWLADPTRDHVRAINDIYAEHNAICCFGTTGDFDNDAGHTTDISDLVALTDFLFEEGPGPDCPGEGNIDADPTGAIGISDVSALVDFLYFEVPLPQCPNNEVKSSSFTVE